MGLLKSTDGIYPESPHKYRWCSPIKETRARCIWWSLRALLEHSTVTVTKYKSVKLILQGVKQWSSSIQLSEGLPWCRDEENTWINNQKLFFKLLYCIPISRSIKEKGSSWHKIGLSCSTLCPQGTVGIFHGNFRTLLDTIQKPLA